MAETDRLKLALPGENDYVDINTLNQNFQKIDSGVFLALAAAAEYSPERTYTLGSYCISGGKLHRCTTAISTAEEWTAAHWTETTIGTELGRKASLDENGKVLASQIPEADSDVFIATYGETKTDEIQAAIDAGKAVFASDGTIIGVLDGMDGGNTHYFHSRNTVFVCIDDVWASNEYKPVPASHASKHASNGEDPINPESIGAAPAYIYSTTDLTAGSSALTTGQMYLVYE